MVVPVSSWRIAGYTVLLYENGAQYTHVRGDCRYWVYTSSGEAFTGLLGELRPELANDVYYGQWTSRCLAGGWVQPGLMDGSTTVFSDGQDRVDIYYAGPPGEIPGAPPEIYAMWQARERWVSRLLAAGEAVEGPIRILVVDDGALVFGLPATPWPLAWPLSSVAISADEASTLGPGEANVVISDPVEVDQVVAIWREYRSGQHGSLARSPPYPFESEGKVYGVVIRRTIPLEDEAGRIPPL